MSNRFIRRTTIKGRQHYQVCERVKIGPTRSKIKVLTDLDWCSSVELRIDHLERQARECDLDAESLEQRPGVLRLDAETAAAQARYKRERAAYLRAEVALLRGLLD
jgi:hypothetical protein